MLDKNTLAKIFAIESAMHHIVAHAVKQRDFELLDAAFEHVPVEKIKQGVGGDFFSRGPSGPLAAAVEAGDLEMVRYLHAKGLGAPVSHSGDLDMQFMGRKVMRLHSEMMGLAIGLGHEEVAIELIFKHPEHEDHFAESTSMSAVIKGVRATEKTRGGRDTALEDVTPLQCAIRLGMPKLARAALDHMDVTLEDDLLEAVVMDSELADEIAAKCMFVTLSKPSLAEQAKGFSVHQKERLADLVVRHNIAVRVIPSAQDTNWLDTKPFLLDGTPLKLLQHVLQHPAVEQWRDQAFFHAAWASVVTNRFDAVRWLAEGLGRVESVTRLLSEVKTKEMALELIRLGADVNQPELNRGLDRFSPMQRAVAQGNEEKMRFWAELGADLAQRTPEKGGKPGKTLLQLAKGDDKEKIKRLLRQLRVQQGVGSAMGQEEDERQPASVSSSGPSPL